MCIISSPASLYSLEAGGPASHRTIFLNMATPGVAPKMAEHINKKIIGGLRQTPFLTLLPIEERAADQVGAPLHNCQNRECALENGRLYAADRVIVGSITMRKKQTVTPLGRENEEQYLLRRIQSEYYSITIEIIDMNDSSTIALIHEKMPAADLDGGIEKLLTAIARYYQPKKISPPQPEHPLCYFITASPSVMLPLGKFRNMADYGAGITLSAGIEDMLFEKYDGRISAGFYHMHPKAGKIDSYISTQLTLLAGYSFCFSGGVNLLPMAGAGYIAHYVKDRGAGGYTPFFDPHAAFQCEMGYAITADTRLIALPEAVLFIERDMFCAYLSIQAGIRINL